MAFSKARRLGELVTTAGVLDQATVATASSGDNDTSPASTAFVTGAISDLADSAPSTLNTLNELAAALGDDANFSTTVTNSIATKLPLAGGTLTGNLAHAGDFTFDCGGDITLDAGGENIRFDLNGNEVGQIDLGSANFTIRTSQNGDIMFRGTPSGGSEIAMLTLDTSASGDATFSNDVYLANGKFLRWGDGSVRIYGDSTDGTELMTFVTGGTERMRISDNGFLKLSSKVSFSGTGDAGLGHHTNNYMYVYGGSAGLILQDNSGGSNRMLIRDTGTVEFEVGGAERMRINSSGRVGIGTTSPGTPLDVNTTAAETIARFNCTQRYTQVDWYNSGAQKGAIWTDSTDEKFAFYTPSGWDLDFYAGALLRWQIHSDGTLLPNGNNTRNIGTASTRVSVLYTANAVNVSDQTLKTEIEDCDLGLDFINTLQPKSYKNLQDVGVALEEGHDDYNRKHYGLIAQDLKDGLLKDSVYGTKDGEYSLAYNDLIAPLIKAVQELKAENDSLKARIETLEG